MKVNPQLPFKIAVAIPTYKRRSLLQRLVKSIPAEWSIYISDNESSLLSLDIVFGRFLKISHLPTLVPMFANWNLALSLVDDDSTHVLIPSDDDLFLPGANEIVADALIKNPDADILIMGCDFIDGENQIRRGYCPTSLEIFPPGEGFLKFQYGVDARMPSILFRRAFLERIGGFDESFKLTAADSELIQRALLLGRSVFIPKVIGLYRIWPGGLTHARQATDEWIKEIKLWNNKIHALIDQIMFVNKLNINRSHDEILAKNILSGASGLVSRGEYSMAREFLLRHPSPSNALLRTRMRLARIRLRVLGYPWL